MLTKFNHTFSLLVVLLLNFAAGASLAQQGVDSTQQIQTSSPTVTASSSGEAVRFNAPGNIIHLRLEVFSSAGEKVFDSGPHDGNVLDWRWPDEMALAFSADSYLCVVTVQSLSGKTSRKLAGISFANQKVTLQPVQVAQLNPVQAQAASVSETDTPLTIIDSEQSIAANVMAHDGSDGQITRTRGALSFRFGDFFRGRDKEQMRLTEEGNLGIGTSKPEFKLDVMGAIRAQQGFVFNDGSILNVNEQGVLTRTTADGSVTPNIGGTGSQNRIAKWTDNSGTLGDSGITETGSGIGIGTANPDSAVNIQGAIPSLLGHMVAVRTTGSNNGFGLLMDAVGSGNNNFGVAVNGAPKGGFSWDNARQFIGFVNYVYSPSDFALRLNSNGSLTYHNGASSVELFRITSAGNVGIGTPSPTSLLHVVGTQPPSIDQLFGIQPSPALQVFGAKGGNTTYLGGGHGGYGSDVLIRAGDGGDGQYGGIGGSITLEPGGAGQGSFIPGGGGQVRIHGGDDALRVDKDSGGGVLASFGSNGDFAIDALNTPAGRFVVTESGKIGIGISAPEQKLHVDGTEILSTGSSAGFKFRNRGSSSSADDWVWYSDSNIARFWRPGAGDMIGVTTAGNVGIGTTAPKAKLDVTGGNILIGNPGQGLILKSPNGSICRLLTIDNAGSIVTSVIACP